MTKIGNVLREIPLPLIDLNIINQFISDNEAAGDLASIHALFAPDPPGAAENSSLKSAFNLVWSKSDGEAPPWLPLQRSFKMARAAREYEKDRCFDVCRALAKEAFGKEAY
jgi:hypothetical protein